jgi:hypothetical protein
MKAYAQLAQRLPDGTRVVVRSDHFAGQCEGIITAGRYDEGWLYRIEVAVGDRLDSERNADREFWVCAFEVQPSQEGAQ